MGLLAEFKIKIKYPASFSDVECDKAADEIEGIDFASFIQDFIENHAVLQGCTVEVIE